MRKSLFATIIVFCVILIAAYVPVPAEEYEENEIEGDSYLFWIEGAYVEARELELRGYLEFMQSEGSDTRLEVVQAEYGFTERIKGFVRLPYVTNSVADMDQNGIGDVEMSGTLALLKQTQESPELSVGLEVSAPTGDEEKGLGLGVWGFEPFIRLSQTWRKIALHGSLSYGMVNDSKEYEVWELGEEEEEAEEETEKVDMTELEFGAALVFMPQENVNLILGLQGGYGTEKSEVTVHETELYITPAAKYEFEMGLEAGVGFRVGLTDDSYDWGVIGMIGF